MGAETGSCPGVTTAGQIIDLGRGTYRVPTLTQKNIVLRGAGTNETVLSGDVRVEVGVSLSGLAVEGSLRVVGSFNDRRRSEFLDCRLSGGLVCRDDAAPLLRDCTIAAHSGIGVQCSGRSSPTLLNCTITGRSSTTLGMGLSCSELFSPTLIDCTITESRSGGVYCVDSASPRLVGSIIRANEGSGLLCRGVSSPTILGCAIERNGEEGIDARDDASAELSNCLIWGNGSRGVVCARNSSVTLANCTIAGNARSGAWKGVAASLTFINCIVWGNGSPTFAGDLQPRVSFSSIEGPAVWPGDGNIKADPLFLRTGAFDFERFDEGGFPAFAVEEPDYRLAPNSPCIDSGISDDAPETAIDGNPRPCGRGVDMGAYEFCAHLPESPYRRGDVNQDGVVALADVTKTLRLMFLGEGDIPCEDAADSNDDGALNISDATHTLLHLFAGSVTIAEPGPETCGVDPTADTLSCGRYEACE